MAGIAMRLGAMAAALPLVTACQANEGTVESAPATAPEGACDAAPAQEHLGHTASAEAGAVLLRITGARQLRWAPPRSAMTMDYRPDRLTVSYDDNMAITRIACG